MGFEGLYIIAGVLFTILVAYVVITNIDVYRQYKKEKDKLDKYIGHFE